MMAEKHTFVDQPTRSAFDLCRFLIGAALSGAIGILATEFVRKCICDAVPTAY